MMITLLRRICLEERHIGVTEVVEVYQRARAGRVFLSMRLTTVV